MSLSLSELSWCVRILVGRDEVSICGDIDEPLVSHRTVRVWTCLGGLGLHLKRLWLWLLRWSGFYGGAGAVLRKRLAKRLLLTV
jgi:hypothetical protein